MTKFAKAKKEPIIAAAAIVFSAVMLNFLAKGVMPFGDLSASVTDLAQGYLPFYYHVRDCLFGDKSLFFDWYTGGVATTENVATNALLSPLNLLLCLVPEDKLLCFMSFFLAIKFSLMAAAACVFFTKRFPSLQGYWAVVLSVLYPLSGYAMLYYSNIVWFDVAALFPLVLLAAENLLARGKCKGFIFLFSLCWIINFYTSFMVSLFIFFAGGAYLLLFLKKDERGAATLRLGGSVFVSLLFSVFINLPAFLQMQVSVRAGEGKSLTEVLTAFEPYKSLGKVLAIVGTELAFAAITMLIIKFKSNKKNTVFLLYLAGLVLLPIICEGTNLVWHAGSYFSFPYRYGFISAFALFISAAYYLEKYHAPSAKTMSKKASWLAAGFFLFVAVAAPCAFLVIAKILDIGPSSAVSACLLAAIGCAGTAIYIILLNFDAKKATYILLTMFLIARTGIVVYTDLAPNGRYESDRIDRYVGETLEVKKSFDAELSALAPLQRVANKDNRLHTNYPLLLGTESTSNWTHVIAQPIQNSARSFGYSVPFTRILDSGGTVFSDAVYNKKLFISHYGMDDDIYAKGKSEGNFTLYEPKLTLPLGLSGSAELAKIEGRESIESFEYQNEIYSALGGEGELFRIAADTKISGTKAYETTLRAEGDEIFYFIYELTDAEKDLGEITTFGLLTLDVNGKRLPVTDYYWTENTVYPIKYNGTLLEVGRFSKGEEISFSLATKYDFIGGRLRIGAMSVERFEALSKRFSAAETVIEGKQSLSLTFNNRNNDEMLLIPVGLDRGFSCTVNGKDTPLSSIGGLTGVPLSDGENKIEIKIMPFGLCAGAVISAASLIVFLLLCLLLSKIKKKKPDLAAPGALCKAAGAVYLTLWLGAVSVAYVFQLFFTGCKVVSALVGRFL